ncbi:hypothetical protein A2U01_0072100 [Trifolium medium]|uniref:Uncharacterized protein n=1 Tax=Trifolium medium TaxID=97028 RepID=A0A392SSM8_9FABA|nr:hypothetical protein [Trifolium medium]
MLAQRAYQRASWLADRFLSLKPGIFGFLRVLVAFCRCNDQCSDAWSLPVAFSRPASVTGQHFFVLDFNGFRDSNML